MAFHYDDVVPWGRSHGEYVRMFALGESELQGTILGCGDGPASFNAELSAQGGTIVSVDPLYQHGRSAIAHRIEQTYDLIMEQIGRERHRFIWRELRDPKHMGETRMASMQRFLDDYEAGRGEGRYVTGSLPSLPFRNGAFDLALSSHLLLFYAEQLDREFHRRSVAELRRVAREVRIFPLCDVNARPSTHLRSLMVELERCGAEPAIVTVPYEFQRGGNQMLRFLGAT